MTSTRTRFSDSRSGTTETIGVCPAPGCQRSFANVKSHIETKHPEWAHEHKEVLA